MYKLWRRELSNPISVELASKKKQSSFTEILANIVKFIKKKEQLYIQILFSISNRPLSSDNTEINSNNIRTNEYQIQIQNILCEEQKIMANFKTYENQSFFISKTYLYTLYVRLMEIFQFSKQKINVRVKEDQKTQNPSWEKYYQDNKLALSDCYQNLIYFQNYHLAQFLALVIRKQNHRIYSLVPPKIKKTQITLKPLIRLSSTELKTRSSISQTHYSKKQSDVDDLLSKKLSKKSKKLQTQKRQQQRKKKVKNPQMAFKSIYGIMNLKPMKIQQGFAFLKGQQIDALQRNSQILDSYKQYVKQYEQRKTKRNQRTRKQ